MGALPRLVCPLHRACWVPGFESFPHPDYAPVTRRYEMSTFGDSRAAGGLAQGQLPIAAGQTGAKARRHTCPSATLRLRYVGHDIVSDARAGSGASTRSTNAATSSPRETLRVHLADPVQPFAVTLCYRLTPEARHHRAVVRSGEHGRGDPAH